MCHSLVCSWETQTRAPFTSRYFLIDDRFQTNIRRHAGVLETYADVPVSDFLLSYVCSAIFPQSILIINTTTGVMYWIPLCMQAFCFLSCINCSLSYNNRTVIGTLQNRWKHPEFLNFLSLLNLVYDQCGVILDFTAHSPTHCGHRDSGSGYLVSQRYTLKIARLISHLLWSVFWLVQKRFQISTKAVGCHADYLIDCNSHLQYSFGHEDALF